VRSDAASWFAHVDARRIGSSRENPACAAVKREAEEAAEADLISATSSGASVISVTIRYYDIPANGLPMSRPSYLSKKLTRSLCTKDGDTLRTVLDARSYMLGLSKDRQMRSQWQRAAKLLLERADVAAVSRQIELALLYEGKLDASVIV
jgi:hypothetical protein